MLTNISLDSTEPVSESVQNRSLQVQILQQFITVATQTSNNNRYVEAKNLPTNLQNTLSYYYNKYNQLQNLNL